MRRRRHAYPDANGNSVTFGYGYTDGFTFGNDHSHRNAFTNTDMPARRQPESVDACRQLPGLVLSQRLYASDGAFGYLGRGFSRISD